MVGVVIDSKGKPVCCEMWPGNCTDVKSLAPVIERIHRLKDAGYSFEWSEIKQDLKSLQEVVIEERGKSLTLRTECLGTCGKVFHAVGVAIPPTIREV